MDFALSEEQQTLQEVLRDFLQTVSPESAVRAQLDDPIGFDRSLWIHMGEQLGLQSMAIPEEFGGSGFGFFELGIVLEEMGRALAVSPFFASAVMASHLLLAIDDRGACHDDLPV